MYAGGDWTLAKGEYKNFQDIYSSATVKAFLRQPETPGFIGPREEMKYRSVTYDTLRILSYDTLVLQDTIRDLYQQTTVSYDTSVITDPNEVIKGITPVGHEMAVRYYDNGKVREKGPMKGVKEMVSGYFIACLVNQYEKQHTKWVKLLMIKISLI